VVGWEREVVDGRTRGSLPNPEHFAFPPAPLLSHDDSASLSQSLAGLHWSVGVLLTQVTRVVLLPHFKNKKLHCAYTETNLETELSTCTYSTNHPQRRRHSSMFRFTASQGNVADKVRLDLYRTFFLFFERKKID
jgi:hypothetical protein